jgi:hypothetical protein
MEVAAVLEHQNVPTQTLFLMIKRPMITRSCIPKYLATC